MPQGRELATHLVRDLHVVTVDLSQTLKDRLQPPGPPAPRIREVDDLDWRGPTCRSHRFHLSGAGHQETLMTNNNEGNLGEGEMVPRGIIPGGKKRVRGDCENPGSRG